MMKNKDKKQLSLRARNQLSITIIILAIACIYGEYKAEERGSTPVQWATFLLALFIIMYLQFFYGIDEFTEIESHEYPNKDDHFPVADIENTEKGAEAVLHFKEGDEISVKTENGNTTYQNKTMTGQPVFVVQPMMVVSQEEFNQKTNTNMPIEENKPGLRLNKGKPTEEPVKSYSLHGVDKKFRAMFDDIHSFATRGETKTLAELEQKIKTHGHPYEKLYAGEGLIAFQFSFMRMPIKGYFGVKE